MKKLIFLLFVIFIGCSSESTEESQPEQKCYNIITRGIDSRGNYIIIQYSNYIQKRYLVTNYQTYINQNTICEPINLTEQSL